MIKLDDLKAALEEKRRRAAYHSRCADNIEKQIREIEGNSLGPKGESESQYKAWRG